MKKILSVILTSLMLISCFGINIFANSVPDDLPEANLIKITRTSSGDYDIKDYKNGNTILEENLTNYIPQDSLKGIANSLSDGFSMNDFSNSFNFTSPYYTILSDDEYIFISNNDDSNYDNWYCDFSVSFDKDIAKDSMALFGHYFGYNVGFFAPFEVKSDKKIPLLNTVMNAMGYQLNWTYSDIKSFVKVFTCGAMNFSSLNNDTTMTVELRIFDNNEFNSADEICDSSNWEDGVNTYVIEKIEYKLDKNTVIPELEDVHDKLYYAGTTDANRSYIPAGYYYLDGYFKKAVSNHSVSSDIPTAYYSDELVAQIGDKKYSTLQLAFEAAENNDTITLIKDAKVLDMIDVTKNLTLDLNGHKITPQGESSQWTRDYDSISGIANDAMFIICDGATLTCEDSVGEGSIETFNANCKLYAVFKFAGNDEVASLVINSGTYKGYWYAVVGNGNRHKTSLIINGGNISSMEPTEAAAIYNPQNGEFVINDGTIEGCSAIYVKSGTPVIINGGKIHATGNAIDFSHNGNGFSATGDALVVENCDYPGGFANVRINGGTFISDNAKAVGTYKYSVDSLPENFVYGGWFSNKLDDTLPAKGYVATDSLAGNGAPSETAPFTVRIPSTEKEEKSEGVQIEIVVEKPGGGTETKTVSVDTTFDTHVLKDGNEKIENIVINNLDKSVSEEEKQEVYKAAAQILGETSVNNELEINVIMNVEVKTSNPVSSLADKIQQEKGNICDVAKVEYIDISLDKVVKANGNVIPQLTAPIKTTDKFQTITLPIADILGTTVDIDSVFAYRNHIDNNDHETNNLFKKVTKEYGPSCPEECYWVDGENIIIKANNFSVYAIGVQNEKIIAQEAPVNRPGSRRYIAPVTGIR